MLDLVLRWPVSWLLVPKQMLSVGGWDTQKNGQAGPRGVAWAAHGCRHTGAGRKPVQVQGLQCGEKLGEVQPHAWPSPAS